MMIPAMQLSEMRCLPFSHERGGWHIPFRSFLQLSSAFAARLGFRGLACRGFLQSEGQDGGVMLQ